MKKLILGLTLFVTGFIGDFTLIILSVIKPHVYSVNGRRYYHLSGFLKGYGLEFVFYLMLITTIIGLLISIYAIYQDKIKKIIFGK